jgi:hypothetical protein
MLRDLTVGGSPALALATAMKNEVSAIAHTAPIRHMRIVRSSVPPAFAAFPLRECPIPASFEPPDCKFPCVS